MRYFALAGLFSAVLFASTAMLSTAKAQEGPPEGAHRGPPPPQRPAISDKMPYESRFVEVLGSKLHYVEGGAGDPILFLHGNPTSSYLWRNVMPHLEKSGRVIALDLIGMGKSDKPDIPYRYQDHIKYVNGFIEALELNNITLVLHDWGSGLGLHYAATHPDNILGIAFMESIVPDEAGLNREATGIFAQFRDEENGPKILMDQNMFVEKLLPSQVIRGLTEAEMEVYRAPYATRESRLPILMWPVELPFADGPEDNKALIRSYVKWFENSPLPKLLFYGDPGAILNPERAMALAERLPNIETHYVGFALHFLQEDHPHVIGRAIADWHRRNIAQ